MDSTVKKAFTKEDMVNFFSYLDSTADVFYEWLGKEPKLLVINPDIIGALSRVEGFFQSEYLQAEVPAHAPIIRYFKLKLGVVTIYESYTEKFMHFE